MQIINRIGAAVIASYVTATSAGAVTVTYTSKVDALGTARLNGSALSVDDAVIVQFEVNENQSPVGSDPTGGALEPYVGIFGTPGTLTQDATSYTITGPFSGIEAVRGAYFEYSDLKVIMPTLGRTYGLGDGFLRASEWQIDLITTGGVEDYVFDVAIRVDDLALNWSWGTNSSNNLDYGSLSSLFSIPQDYSETFFTEDASELGFTINPNAPLPNRETIALFDGTISVANSTPQPPISAVPLPAPFLMLGMAMLGLTGFGRRAQS